ncbi:hypothetical protein HDV00_004469 [Rhizophlyctis rosea]|nr:hypothetical protein HDV00_004469 [Rhizophlyctis rosea]
MASTTSSQPSAGVRRGSNAAHSLTSRRASLSDDQLQRSLSRHHSPLTSSVTSEGSTGTLRKATSVATPGPIAHVTVTATSTLGVPMPLNNQRRKSQDRGSMGSNTGITKDSSEKGTAHNPAHYNSDGTSKTSKTPNGTVSQSSPNVDGSTEGSGTLVDLAPSQQLWSSSLTLLKARQARLAASGAADGKARLSPAADPNESRTAMIGWGMSDPDSEQSEDENTPQMKNSRSRSNPSSRPTSTQKKSTTDKGNNSRSRPNSASSTKAAAASSALPPLPTIFFSESTSTLGGGGGTGTGSRLIASTQSAPPTRSGTRKKKKLARALKGLGHQMKILFVGGRVGVASVGNSPRTSRTELNTFW